MVRRAIFGQQTLSYVPHSAHTCTKTHEVTPFYFRKGVRNASSKVIHVLESAHQE